MVGAGHTANAQDSVSRPPDRIGRLEQWLEAVERHEPGAADDPLMRVASWDRTTLWRVWVDLLSLVSLVREPEVLLFSAPAESEPFSGFYRLPPTQRRMRVIAYSRAEISRLKSIAKETVTRGGEDLILKRGASLHADIVMLGADTALTPDAARQPRSSTVMLFLSDGQQTGVSDASVHWEMGRRLLDKVRSQTSRTLHPDPGSDETVRLWYLVSNVFMQATEQLDPWHVDRAVQLFPRDPAMLFFAGCAREMFSGPQIQNVLESTTLRRDQFSLVGNEGAELRSAERLLRESLEHDPKQPEARIRLGRILGRRGRHQDAIVELRQATMDTRNRLLQYYGLMFLGAEADALALTDEASQAYERALELFPLAQSPRLALGALAARHGDRADAFSAVQPVLVREDMQPSDDPWWSYYTSQTRGLEGLVTALHAAIEKGSK